MLRGQPLPHEGRRNLSLPGKPCCHSHSCPTPMLVQRTEDFSESCTYTVVQEGQLLHSEEIPLSAPHKDGGLVQGHSRGRRPDRTSHLLPGSLHSPAGRLWVDSEDRRNFSAHSHPLSGICLFYLQLLPSLQLNAGCFVLFLSWQHLTGPDTGRALSRKGNSREKVQHLLSWIFAPSHTNGGDPFLTNMAFSS